MQINNNYTVESIQDAGEDNYFDKEGVLCSAKVRKGKFNFRYKITYRHAMTNDKGEYSVEEYFNLFN